VFIILVMFRLTFIVIFFPCCVLGLVHLLVVFHAHDNLNKPLSRLHYSCGHYSCFVYFFVEVKCGLSLYFKCKCFQKDMDYPPFEHIVEVVDHPPFVKVLIYIYFWPCLFQEKNSFDHGKSYYYP
jgi:hypothetical protein